MSTHNSLIRGGTVVDGSLGQPFRSDIRVRGGRIIEIGPDLKPDGEDILDAAGAYVAPGFIDTHTHLDPTLFWDPSCDPMPQHGVTTAVVGNCSLSLAPVHSDRVKELTELFCYIEDMPLQSFELGVLWNWSSYPEYRAEIRGRSRSLRVLDLVGHSPLRLWVMGRAAWERSATPTEVEEMAMVLDQALLAGAGGLSSSIFDRDASGRPVPSAQSDDSELRALVEVLGRHGKLFEFIPEVRTDQWVDDVDRFASLCGRYRVPLTYNGISCDTNRAGWFSRALEQAEVFSAQGIQVAPQISPRPIDIQVNWGGGMSMSYLPAWHRVIQSPADRKRQLLEDDGWRETARREWDTIESHILPNRHPDRIILISVARADLSKWVGRSLADLAIGTQQHPSDALAQWVLDNDLHPGVMSRGVRNDHTDDVAEAIRHPLSLVSNSDAGAHLNMFSGAGDGTLLLTKFVRDRGDLSLERAIYELTSRQAEFFGIHDLGHIRIGASADLTVFALEDLNWSEPTLEADLPGEGTRLRRPAGGYRYTMVNGVITQENGVLSGNRPVGGGGPDGALDGAAYA